MTTNTVREAAAASVATGLTAASQLTSWAHALGEICGAVVTLLTLAWWLRLWAKSIRKPSPAPDDQPPNPYQ